MAGIGSLDLADELGRAFVEADHRRQRIRRLRIEIQHILHARDVLAIDLGNAPHGPTPGFELVLRQPSSHRLAREIIMIGEFDHLIGQEFERPAGASRRRRRAGGRRQKGRLLGRELTFGSRTRLVAEGAVEVAFDKAALGPIDGRTADLKRPGDPLVRNPSVGGQEDLRPHQFARRQLTALEHPLKVFTLLLAEVDPDILRRPAPPLLGAQVNPELIRSLTKTRRP